MDHSSHHRITLTRSKQTTILHEAAAPPSTKRQNASNLSKGTKEDRQVTLAAQRSKNAMLSPVLFYVPNLIGYLRLILLIVAWIFFDNIYVFLPLYATSAFLDCIDGCLARRLKQTSAFGAWLDVLVDNIGRSIIWGLLPYSWGIFVICLEWSVFVCTHTAGQSWKNSFAAAPWWVKYVMDNGFYTLVGVFTISGIHALPPYLYFYTYYFKHKESSWSFLNKFEVLLIIPIVVLGAGRLVGLAVELWCIKTHILHLLHLEENKQVDSITEDLHKEDTS